MPKLNEKCWMSIQKRRATLIVSFITIGYLLIASLYLRPLFVRKGNPGRYYPVISVMIFLAVFSMGCCALGLIHHWRVSISMKVAWIIAAILLILWSSFWLILVACVLLMFSG